MIQAMEISEDLSRDTYGLLGIPVDAIDMATVARRIENATNCRSPYLISTANLNFLVTSRSDHIFKESLLASDLCTPDGMPILWLARLLSIPIKRRLAGSDIFVALKSQHALKNKLKVYFLGGAEGAAATACQRLNAEGGGMTCVGSFYPGFGSIEDMSADPIVGTINETNADFLAVALGAKKGQAWLYQNHHRLRIPVRAHLGAVINFQAGSLKRAPKAMQRWGLEWLWRIKEEPYLWRRYWSDGLILIQLVLTRIIPLIALAQWHMIKSQPRPLHLELMQADDLKSVTLNVNGDATAEHVDAAQQPFQAALEAAQDVVINCAGMQFLDARFIGLLLMLNKQLKQRQLKLSFTGVPPRIERIFRLNEFEFLLRT
jgi:N-acetylglucosaminyldiphosphoundecaprenol N-acetyl-beta-D-mannosaminyltransferase